MIKKAHGSRLMTHRVAVCIIFLFQFMVCAALLKAADYRIIGNVTPDDREEIETLLQEAEEIFLPQFELTSKGWCKANFTWKSVSENNTQNTELVSWKSDEIKSRSMR